MSDRQPGRWQSYTSRGNTAELCQSERGNVGDVTPASQPEPSAKNNWQKSPWSMRHPGTLG